LNPRCRSIKINARIERAESSHQRVRSDERRNGCRSFRRGFPQARLDSAI
jgi:hypothetical protein